LGDLEIRHAGIQGRAEAPDRPGGEIYFARPALPVATVRLRLDRGGQHPGRGRAMGQAADDCGTGRRGVGTLTVFGPADVIPGRAGGANPESITPVLLYN